MEKYYWISYTGVYSGGLTFGNQYVKTFDKFFDCRSLQNMIAADLKMSYVTILFWRDVTQEEFDMVVARDVTFLEMQHKKKGD